MSVSSRRIKEVLNYAFDREDNKACDFFNIKQSTISKYRRDARRLGIDYKEKYEAPKILLYDLETSPILAYLWQLGKQRVGTHQVKESWTMLTWAAKWLCDNKIMGEKVSVADAVAGKDKKIVYDLYDLMEEADILIAYNGKGFDRKVMNTRFVLNGIDKPPSPYRMIDPLLQIRKQFRFLSNRMNYIAQTAINNEKQKTNFSLWTRCLAGDGSALTEMLAYNKHDVRILEDIFLKFRPWFTGIPNMGLYYEDKGNRCHVCGSQSIKLGKKGYYTSVGRYKTIRCQECGALSRERYMDISAEERKGLLRAVAR